jgi:hypothetical protein
VNEKVANGSPRDYSPFVRTRVIMDFPAAWEYVRERATAHGLDEHHERCSFRTERGALLCDCDVLWDEYERRGGTRP